MSAILNCKEKTISFIWKDKFYKMDLTDGDLEDSWNSFVDKEDITWDTNFSWEEIWDEAEPFFSVYGLGEEEDGSFYTNTDIHHSIEIVKVIGAKEDYFRKVKLWSYSVSTEILWTSFDFGEVRADDYNEALQKACAELDDNFRIANKALEDADTGFSVSYDARDIKIEEVK